MVGFKYDELEIPYVLINTTEEYPPPLNKKIAVSVKYIDPRNPKHNFMCSDATLVRQIKEEQDESKINC